MNYSKEYSKCEIIKRICQSAQRYKENLLDKNIIFIFENKKAKKIDYIETIFTKYNFLHFTGIYYYQNSIKFFKDCLNQELSVDNIKIKNKFFTQSKLEVLENAMSINKSAKRIGDFNQSKVNITIEKVVGNTHYCLGFSNLDSNNKKLKYYYPKTLLQDNLKNNIIDDNKIIAILSKNKNQKIYNEITYISEKMTLLNLKENNLVSDLIDYEEIFSHNLRYQEKIHEYINKK